MPYGRPISNSLPLPLSLSLFLFLSFSPSSRLSPSVPSSAALPCHTPTH